MTLSKKNIKSLIKECMFELKEAYSGPNSHGGNSGTGRSGQAYLPPEEESKGRWRQFCGELETQVGRDFCDRVIDVFREDNGMLISFLELAEDYPDHQDKLFAALRKLERT